MCDFFPFVTETETGPETEPSSVYNLDFFDLEYYLDDTSQRDIFVSIATIRNNNSRPFIYRSSEITCNCLHTSKILAHSVAERFAIR